MRHPNPFIIQFQEAWEERQQLHIRTALAECGDLATYLEAIGDTGGLDEGRCWKLLFELSSVRIKYGSMHSHTNGPLLRLGIETYTFTRHPTPRLETSQHPCHRYRKFTDQ
jgi:hypothetical protein